MGNSTTGSSNEFNKDVRSDWTPEKASLCVPENFTVLIDVGRIVFDQLTEEERERLGKKLDLVIKSAQKLAANMLKGTLKYKQDNWPVSAWLDYLEDDATDTLNYIQLIKQRIFE